MAISKARVCKFLKSACNLSRVFRVQEFSLFETAVHIDDGQSIFVYFSSAQVSCGRKRRTAWLTTFGVDTSNLGRGMFWSRKLYLPKAVSAIFSHHLRRLLPRWRGLSSSLEGCRRSIREKKTTITRGGKTTTREGKNCRRSPTSQ